jgi:hypothetical protein
MSVSAPLIEEHKGRNDERCDVLKKATPYPWGRDAKGNLIGANGHAIYFMGEDSVLVEHAPVLLEALISVREKATLGTIDPGDALHAIWRLVDNLIVVVERANRCNEDSRGLGQTVSASHAH